MQSYVGGYDDTRFAYAGGTDTEQLGLYACVDGPKVWIDISTRRGIVLEGSHYHSSYCEQGCDYRRKLSGPAIRTAAEQRPAA